MIFGIGLVGPGVECDQAITRSSANAERQGELRSLPFFDAAAVGSLPWPTAIAALREVLTSGFDPDREPARTAYPFGAGELLCMPSTGSRFAGIKLATVASHARPDAPRIQGVYVLFDARALTPVALIDGPALTSVRTPAVSALAVDLLAPPQASRLIVFGAGPQAEGHVHALRAIRPLERVTVVGRDPTRAEDLCARLTGSGVAASVGTPEDVADADLVACCTTSPKPLFDGRRLRDDTVVVACGSHSPERREVDGTTVKSGAVVESLTAATTEAGDVVLAIAEGSLNVEGLVTLADLVTGRDTRRPRLVKTVGMGWEDLAVGAAVVDTVPATS